MYAIRSYYGAYPIFREIYRLEARKIKRFEQPEYVLLITLEHQTGTSRSGNGQLDTFLMGKIMDRLENRNNFV